jgi:hypothetical protein
MARCASKKRWCHQTGQAFVELAICLLVLVALFVGAVTYRRLAVAQHYTRRDVRAEVGVKALRHGPEGWVNPIQGPETRMHLMHRMNAYNRLEEAHPMLSSQLPSSAYTLASRDLPEAELGLQTVTKENVVPLQSIFADLMYGKKTVTIREQVTFPSATNLWRE